MLSPLQVPSNLTLALRTFWREKTGIQPRRIRVNLDRDTALILLEQALLTAEIEKVQNGEGTATPDETWLQEVLKPCLQSIVEETTRQKVTQARVYIDFPVGNVIGIFIFTENLVRYDA